MRVALAFALSSSTSTFAATLFTGPSGGAIDNIAYWDNGLPSGTNQGTIQSGSTARIASGVTYSGYYVDVESGGEIDGSGLNQAFLSAGVLNLNGGSLNASRGMNLTGGQTLTISAGGSWDLNDRDTNVSDSGTTITLNSGTIYANNKGINLNTGTVMNIHGGIVGGTAAGTVISKIDGGVGGGGTVNFYGGTTTITTLGYAQNPGDMVYNIIGSSGSITAGSFDGQTYGQIDWFTGTGMTLTITGSATWAEDEYNAGRLTYNGGDNTALGLTWAQAQTDLGDGSYFVFNTSTNTLSLAAVPEPSSLILLGAGMTALGVIRRRRHA